METFTEIFLSEGVLFNWFHGPRSLDRFWIVGAFLIYHFDQVTGCLRLHTRHMSHRRSFNGVRSSERLPFLAICTLLLTRLLCFLPLVSGGPLISVSSLDLLLLPFDPGVAFAVGWCVSVMLGRRGARHLCSSVCFAMLLLRMLMSM